MKAAQACVAGEKSVGVGLPQTFFVSAFSKGKVDLSILRFMISPHLSPTPIFWEKSPCTQFVAFPFLKAICQCFKFFPTCPPWDECSGWPLVSGLINFQFYVRRQPGGGRCYRHQWTINGGSALHRAMVSTRIETINGTSTAQSIKTFPRLSCR